MKVLMVVCFSLLVSLSSVFAVEVGEWAMGVSEGERGVYSEYREKIYDLGDGVTDEQREEVKLEVLEKYEIAGEKFDDISGRVGKGEPTALEWEIYRDWGDRLDAVREGGIAVDYNKLYKDIGETHGVPAFVVDEIVKRVLWYDWVYRDGEGQ